MLVLVHVVVSVLSLILATFNLVKPSKNGLYGVYGLTIGAFVSGVLLVITTGADPVKSCISGSLYLGFVVVSSVFTSKRLSRAT